MDSPWYKGLFTRSRLLKKLQQRSTKKIPISVLGEHQNTLAKQEREMIKTTAQKEHKNLFTKMILRKEEVDYNLPALTLDLEPSDLVKEVKENVIFLYKVNKFYSLAGKQNKVLSDISLKIKRGERVVILGPSGSGKTTLLNVIGGIDTIDNGYVYVNGENISNWQQRVLTEYRRKHIGFIFQNYNLLPFLNVYQNTELGYSLCQNKSDDLTVAKILEFIEMAAHANKLPYQLSGGQSQRVCIARALVKNPSILLCDEPTGALDEINGRNILQLFEQINANFQTTLILITHNPNFAKFAHHVIRIVDGKIIEDYYNKEIALATEIKWA